MLIAQIPAQVDHPDLVFTVSSGIGSLVRSSHVQQSLERGRPNPSYWRSQITIRGSYGKPTRPPINQERSLRMQPSAIRPLLASQPASVTQGILPIPHLNPCHSSLAPCMWYHHRYTPHLCLRYPHASAN